jgi:DNA-binding GntR family transcriptional regulator
MDIEGLAQLLPEDKKSNSSVDSLPELPSIQASKKKLSDHVYDVICDYIIKGRLEPGQRLREAEVAKALNVSRTPVREAFARLERQHLLERDPTGAYLVPVWDRQTLWEVATLRGTLEGLAASLLEDRLDEADCDFLQSIINRMGAAYKRGDYDALIELDITFHSFLWSRTHHSILIETLNRMKAQVLYFMYITRPGDEETYEETHQELLDLFCSEDNDRAVAAIKEHILVTAEKAIERMFG